ncbi:hypothetical protein ACS0TY_001473 [Phlomoides rotata]
MNRDRKGKRKIEEDLGKSRKRELLEGKKSSRSKLSFESGSEPDFVLKTRKRDNIKDDNYHNECDDTNSQNSVESLKVNKKKRNQSLKNSGGTDYRSNLRTCIKELGDLHFSEEHLMTIRRMPFWLMFKAIYDSDKNKLMKRCWKYEDNIREIILSFNRDVERFVVGRELISLKQRDVQLIFGLCGGGDIEIPLKGVEYGISPWIRRCFRSEIDTLKSKFILYENVIYKKLSEVLSMSDGTSIVDAARLTHLYLMAAVLSPNRNASISPHLAVYLEKLDDACRYDWCGYVLNMLLNQLKSTKNTKAEGCTMLQPFWLCEHTNLVRPVHEVGFPRFLKWDLNDLEKQHKLLKLTDLEAKFVGPLKLKTSTQEQKQFEKLLHYWKEHMITETQSTDDNQDTQDMPSLENEKIHSLSDPTQTSSGSGGELNLTPELETTLEKDSVEVAVCYGMKNDEMNKLILQVDEFKSMISEKDNKIEQLKENLSRVENGFNGRLKEQEEKHEREILEKDEVIAMLRAEVEGLRNNINSESTPTLTQNFHQSDSVDETPVPKHKQVKSYPESGSMAKRIKERTENEERRLVVITLQPNTREIIQIHENEGEGNRVKKKVKPLDLRESHDVVRKPQEIIKKEIKSAFNKIGEDGVVWKGLSPLAQVTVRDVLMILHHLQISNAVIDSWTDILLAMYEELPSVERIIIFTSKCWDLVTSVHDHKNRKFWVDDQLYKVSPNGLLIFPLLVTDYDGSLREVRNHWTILILDLEKCQWSFYNSLRPRRGAVADQHLKGSFFVVKYVENKLSEVFKNKYPHHPLLRGRVKQPDSVPCLQQFAGSLDCGIVVCYHIENIIQGQPKMTGSWSKNKAADYRAKMVTWFIDPAHVKI